MATTRIFWETPSWFFVGPEVDHQAHGSKRVADKLKEVELKGRFIDVNEVIAGLSTRTAVTQAAEMQHTGHLPATAQNSVLAARVLA